MNLFLLLFFHRLFSGATNGAGYGKKNDLMNVFATASLIVAFFLSGFIQPNIISLSVFVLVLASTTLKIDKLHGGNIGGVFGDIHFLEAFSITLPIFAICLSGESVFICAISVYPSLIFHKGFVNVFAGKNFFDQKTDDETGKTWSLPSLNIKVPRSSNAIRLIIASLSIAGLFLYLHFQPNFSFLIFKL